jgi:hypothetical protein
MTFNTYINTIANMLFGGVGDVPANYQVGLSTTMPNDDGTNITEVSTSLTGYARITIANNKTNLTNAVDGEVTNIAAQYFNDALLPWGTIAAVVVWDDANNPLYAAPLTTPRPVETGDTARFPIGALQWIVNNILD